MAAESKEQAGKKQKVTQHCACELAKCSHCMHVTRHSELWLQPCSDNGLPYAMMQVAGLSLAGFIDALHRVAAVRFTKISDVVSLAMQSCIL